MIRLRVQLGLNSNIRTVTLVTEDFFILLAEDLTEILTEDNFNIFIT